MSFSLHITKRAYSDLLDALNYIEYELFNPDAADKLQDKVSETLLGLVSFPKRYPLVPDEVLRSWGVRFAMVGNYYIFFTIRGKKVYFIRFLHKSRNWVKILGDGIELE